MKKENNKKIIRILIIAVIAIVAWLLFIYPLIKFNSNEKAVRDAAEKYLKINTSMLPNEGSIRTIDVQTLVDKKFISDIRTAYNGDTCDVKSSFVKVKRVSGEYKYYTYLKCGIFSSTIDHKGPVITLNGDSVVNVEKNDKFTDPGVKSLTDNTDGVMDVSKVEIKGEVDTSKNGIYYITYKAFDSLENKTEIKRKVVVSENLTNTVKKAANSNVYKGNDDNLNNYIKFSGQLFRIIGLDNDGNVKIVSNEDVAQVDYNSIDSFLNNYYYEHLNTDSKKYVVENYKFCNKDEVTNANKESIIDCKNTKRQNVGILSIVDYNNSKVDGESFLYPDTIGWTSSSLNDKKAWTTRELFYDKDSKYLDYKKNLHFNVRPVIVLKKNLKLTGGDGSLNDPFDIGDFNKVKAGKSVKKARSGEYIVYKKTKYRIVDNNVDGYVKVISDDNIELDVEDFDTPSIYNPEENGTLAYYIENETSKYINSKIFTKKKVSVPIYKNKASFNGKKETKKYNVKFTVPSMYEMYSTSATQPIYYIESSKNNDVHYFTAYNGTILYVPEATFSMINTKYVGYLRKDLIIVSGEGTKEEPYNVSY